MVPPLVAVLALLAPPVGHAGEKPAIELGVRTAAGPEETLASRGARLYLATPEIMLGVRASAHLDVLAGCGAGAAVLVRPSGGVVDLTASGTLGVRLRGKGANLLALARAEGLAGGGAAIGFHLQLSFDRAP